MGNYLRDLGKEAHQTAVSKGWYEQHRTVPELLCLVHSEISEALESWRDATPNQYVSASGKPEGLTIELADAIIRIADLAEHLGLDIDSAIDLKMAYNKTRPHRHGGKLA